jgi:phage head maturation protease
MFFATTPQPPQAPPLVRLRGKLPLGHRSGPSRSGSQIRIPPGAFRHLVGKCRICLDHGQSLTHGTLREVSGALWLDFSLDPLNKLHAGIIDSIRRGVRWGISPAFRATIEMHCAGEDHRADVLRVDQLHEISLSRRAAFTLSSITVLEN